jgi:hypothetical protein
MRYFLHCASESILARSAKSSLRITSRLLSSPLSLLDEEQEPKLTAETTRSYGVFWSHLVKQHVAILRHAHTLVGSTKSCSDATNLGLAPWDSDWIGVYHSCHAEHAEWSLIPARFSLVTGIQRVGLLYSPPCDCLDRNALTWSCACIFQLTSKKILLTFLQMLPTSSQLRRTVGSTE